MITNQIWPYFLSIFFNENFDPTFCCAACLIGRWNLKLIHLGHCFGSMFIHWKEGWWATNIRYWKWHTHNNCDDIYKSRRMVDNHVTNSSIWIELPSGFSSDHLALAQRKEKYKVRVDNKVKTIKTFSKFIFLLSL